MVCWSTCFLGSLVLITRKVFMDSMFLLITSGDSSIAIIVDISPRHSVVIHGVVAMTTILEASLCLSMVEWDHMTTIEGIGMGESSLMFTVVIGNQHIRLFLFSRFLLLSLGLLRRLRLWHLLSLFGDLLLEWDNPGHDDWSIWVRHAHRSWQ